MSMSKMKKNKMKKEKGGDRWSNGLPKHVLQLIPERLQISDYQSFRHVCLSWRGVIEDGIVTKTCPPAAQLPWLLLRSNDFRHAFYIENQYYFVRDPKIFRSVANSFSYPNCVGSIGAWLIMAAEHRLNNNNTRVVNFFFNPISGGRVMLPSQSTNQSHLCNELFFFKKVVASSDPGAQQPKDCLVAGVSCDGLLAICRPTDASWSLIKIDGLRSRDIEIIDEKLYTITQIHTSEFIVVYKTRPTDAGGIRAEMVLFSILPSINHWKWRTCCLAKYSEAKELFVILNRIPVKRQSHREGLFRVFKLESSLTHRLTLGARWAEVVDLGDRMLFLSEASNKSIHDQTLGRNCIYFAFDFRSGLGVYSMENRRIKPLSFRKDKASFDVNNRTLWFTPHPW